MSAKVLNFTNQMLCLVDAGLKTQTRRIVQVELVQNTTGLCIPSIDVQRIQSFQLDVNGKFSAYNDFNACMGHIECPYGKVGDVIVLRDVNKSIELTGIRIERLRDISTDDVLGEGFKVLSKDGGRTFKYGIPDRDGWPGNDDTGWHWQDWKTDPLIAFKTLFTRIYDDKTWRKNPFVWRLEFKLVTP